MAAPTRALLAPLAEQAAAGNLQVSVADVLTFEQATDGLGRLATGGAGGAGVRLAD